MHELDAYGDNVKLVKMRNPWGTSGEWKGDWSDKSDCWTPDLRKQVGSTDEDDGIFFIPIEDYMTHFSDTSVCVASSQSCPMSVANYQSLRTVYYEFDLKKDCNHMAISVF